MIEALIGVVGGVLVGSTGAGMGLLVTPLLILAGYSPLTAVGTVLGVTFLSKLAGAIVHHQLGHMPGRDQWWLIAGGAIGVGIAWWVARAWIVPTHLDADVWVKRVLALILILASIALWKIDRTRAFELVRTGKSRSLLLPLGAGVGTLQALTSAGSGSLLVPILASVTAWEVPQMAAVSNLFGWIVGGLSVAMHFNLGHIDSHLLLRVTLGLLPGVVVGSLLSRRISRVWFMRGTGAIVFGVGLRLLLA